MRQRFLLFGSCLFATLCALPLVAQAVCTGADHLMSFRVLSGADPLPDATIRVYTESTYRNVADNLLLTGIEDAILTTAIGGRGSLRLAEGTYYAQVIALNHQEYRASFSVPAEGTCGATDFFLTPYSPSGDFDIERTVVTLDPPRIPADGKTTSTLTIQAFNRFGSVVPHLPVSMTVGFPGMAVTQNEAVTDRIGKATFSITARIEGLAPLIPMVNNTGIRTLYLTIANASEDGGGASVTSTRVSGRRSSVVMFGSPAEPNGISPIRLNVTIRDEQGGAMANRRVLPRAAITGISITPNQATTSATGEASFLLTSTATTAGFITFLADGVGLEDRPYVVFQPTMPVMLEPGIRIKLPDDLNPDTQEDTTVYYYGRDGKRHPFQNATLYYSWFSTFGGLLIVRPEEMARIPLGSPVPMRPGTRLLKLPSIPKVYAVSKPHELRWLTSETLAEQTYGSAWKSEVADLPEAFFTLYTVGPDIKNADDYRRGEQLARTLSIDETLP